MDPGSSPQWSTQDCAPQGPPGPRGGAPAVDLLAASFIYMYCSYFVCNLFPNGPSPRSAFLPLPRLRFLFIGFSTGGSVLHRLSPPLRVCVVCKVLDVVGSGGQV